MLDQADKLRLREIVQNVVEGNENFFHAECIDFGIKGDYWILNYKKGSERTLHGRLCRGLVVNRIEQRIISMPFARFFNFGEKGADSFDFADAEIMEKMDGCLEKNVNIHFCNGSVHRIKDVYEKKLVGPIWGYDTNTQKIIPSEIVAWHKHGLAKDWVRVRIDYPTNGYFRIVKCTPEHLFWTNKGYVQAQHLKLNDICYRMVDSLNKIQKSMLYGSLLGDCSIYKSKLGGYRISWSHALPQDSYSQLICKILSPIHANRRQFVPKNSFSKNEKVSYVFNHGVFAEICGVCRTTDKSKTITKEWLDQIDEISLAFWYQDDGSLSTGNASKQKPRALFHTEGFNENEQNMLIEMLITKFNIAAVKQKYRGYTCLRLNKDAADILWTIISPYIHKDMKYKLPEKYRNTPCFWDNYIAEPFCKTVSEANVLGVDPGLISDKKKSANRYDLTTTTSNFIANGIVVHNSMVGLSFPQGDVSQPFWQTRKMISTHDHSFNMKSFYGENFKIMEMIGDYIKVLTVSPKFAKCTFVFECIHKHTQVITKYTSEQYGLYLIGCRELEDYHEFSEMELDIVAVAIGAKRPRRWPTVTSAAEIIAMFSQFPKDYEGMVVRHKGTSLRNKVKSEDYMKVHHLLTSISYKNLIPLWIEGEEEEIVSYFKQAASKMDTIKKAWDHLLGAIVMKATWWNQQQLDRKTIAMQLTGHIASDYEEKDKFMRGCIFGLLGKPQDQLMQIADANLKKQSVYTLLEALKLDDDDEVLT
jgi:hypothetical protein